MPMARFAAVLMLLATACAQLPEKPCPVCPPAKPAPERAQYLETSFASLPGWNAAQLEPSLRAFMAGRGPRREPSLRAFMAGCARPGSALSNACLVASIIEPGGEAAARQFFESYFVP